MKKTQKLCEERYNKIAEASVEHLSKFITGQMNAITFVREMDKSPLSIAATCAVLLRMGDPKSDNSPFRLFLAGLAYETLVEEGVEVSALR